VNTEETCLPEDTWTKYASATFRLDLDTTVESEIQLLLVPALPKTRDFEEAPKTPIEYPAIVTKVVPDDGIGADLTLEIKHFE